MNKIKRKEKLDGKQVYKFREKEESTYVFQSDGAFEATFLLKQQAHLKVFHYGKDTSGVIRIFLEGESAEIEYHYNTVNKDDHTVKVEVFHEAKKTTSKLFLHGLNQDEKTLSFIVDVTIPKGMCGAKAMQENQIYNQKNGSASILPNLYIEEFDVDAEHASFIGPFSEEVVFYLKTRGLKENIIERLLLEGLLIQEGLEEDEKFDFFQIRKEG